MLKWVKMQKLLQLRRIKICCKFFIQFKTLFQSCFYRCTQKCTVISCPNVDDAPGRGALFFFNFPQDKEVCQVWKQKCGIASHHPVSTAKVCASHFRAMDFKGSKRKLIADAVPRENLHWMVGAPEIKASDLNYNKQTRRWEVIVELESGKNNTSSLDNQTVDWCDVQEEVNHSLLLEERYSRLLEEDKKWVKAHGVYKRKIAGLNQRFIRIKGEIEKHRGKSTMNPDESLIYKMFSQAQINFLLAKKKVVWSHDDMARAFTLRQAGNKELYLYLKDTLNMPLPSLSSVQKWAAAKLS